MKRTLVGFFVAIIVFIFSLNYAGVTSAQTETPTPEPTPTIVPVIATMQTEIDLLETEVSNLQTKASPKDIWDKLTAISGLLSGLLVAAIGGIATYTYNERKRTADQSHNERELAVQRIQTIHNFMPQLQSDDSRAIEAAILSISTLDAKLATDLATLFQSAGTVTALSKIATSANPVAAKQAEASLSKLFHSLRSAIITVLNSDGEPTGAGFLISAKGHIYTTNHVINTSQDIKIKWEGKIYQVKVIERNDEKGIALLKIEGENFPFLDVTQTKSVNYQDKVFALIFDKDIGLNLSSGQIIGVDVKMKGKESQSFLATDLKSSVGSGGLPVINANGQIIGAVYAMKINQDVTILTPASLIFSLIEKIQVIEKA